VSGDEDGDGDDPGDAGAGPFDDLDAGSGRHDDPFAALDESSREEEPETFESVDVDAVPIEQVWASIDDEGAAVGEREVSVGGDSAEAVGTDDHRVPKREYCARCPHFAAPPEVACTHEDASIVAVEDAEQFVVRNCPMVDRDGASGES
jgi:hypothetical protein